MAKLAPFTMLFTAKTHGKTRLVQYVIPAKSPFKTSKDTLQIMLLNLKKHTTRILSAILTALRPYDLP